MNELKCEGLIDFNGKTEECGKNVTEKVANYSNLKYGKIFCYDCQHKNPLVIKEIEKKSKEPKEPKDITQDYDKSVTNWKDEIINFETLLNEAYKKFEGEFSIYTELMSHDSEKRSAVFKAKVLRNNQEYQAHGDADQENCGEMIKPHYLRMAETRAIARALRWATNNAKVSEEEK